jgi:hypothetical protein
MAHECDECGQECYCDGDDTGGLPMPRDCRHYLYCSGEITLEDESDDGLEAEYRHRENQ